MAGTEKNPFLEKHLVPTESLAFISKTRISTDVLSRSSCFQLSAGLPNYIVSLISSCLLVTGIPGSITKKIQAKDLYPMTMYIAAFVVLCNVNPVVMTDAPSGQAVTLIVID